MNDEMARYLGDEMQRAAIRACIWRMAGKAFVGLGIVCAAALIYLSLAAVVPTKAHAVQLDQQGCLALAVWSHDVALMRDVGADKEKVRAYFEKNKDEHPIYVVLLRRFEELWATKEVLQEIAPPVYQDCIRRRGQYGADA
jgi:hypothetical protein